MSLVVVTLEPEKKFSLFSKKFFVCNSLRIKKLQAPHARFHYRKKGVVLEKRELAVCLKCQSGDDEMTKSHR